MGAARNNPAHAGYSGGRGEQVQDVGGALAAIKPEAETAIAAQAAPTGTATADQGSSDSSAS